MTTDKVFVDKCPNIRARIWIGLPEVYFTAYRPTKRRLASGYKRYLSESTIAKKVWMHEKNYIDRKRKMQLYP